MDKESLQSRQQNLLDQVASEDRRRSVDIIDNPHQTDFIVQSDAGVIYSFLSDENFLLKYSPSSSNNPLYFRFKGLFGIDESNGDNFSNKSRYFHLRNKLYKKENCLRKGGYFVFIDMEGKYHYHAIIEIYLSLPKKKEKTLHASSVGEICKKISGLFKEFLSL